MPNAMIDTELLEEAADRISELANTINNCLYDNYSVDGLKKELDTLSQLEAALRNAQENDDNTSVIISMKLARKINLELTAAESMTRNLLHDSRTDTASANKAIVETRSVHEELMQAITKA